MSEDYATRFSDPEHVARYVEGVGMFVPGLADMHRMAAVLLAERAPADARVLVLGAGGGLELRAFARARPGWRFDGVDPSADMLAMARETAVESMDRITLHQGVIDDAPDGPYDAASALLVLHFLPPEERRRTMEAIRRRLKPGAPLVAVHASFDRRRPGGDVWLDRDSEFAALAGADAATVADRRERVGAAVNILAPEVDEMLIAEAGFADPVLFYAAFSWRGWVAHA